MNPILNQVFKNITQIEPSKELEGMVLGRIESEMGKRIKRKLYFSYVGLGSSLVVGFWTIFAFGNTIIHSEFWNLLSLAFTDAQVVAGYWKTYSYSLLETLPTLSLALILIPILGLFVSIGFYLDFKNKGKYFYNNHHFKLA